MTRSLQKILEFSKRLIESVVANVIANWVFELLTALIVAAAPFAPEIYQASQPYVAAAADAIARLARWAWLVSAVVRSIL